MIEKLPVYFRISKDGYPYRFFKQMDDETQAIYSCSSKSGNKQNYIIWDKAMRIVDRCSCIGYSGNGNGFSGKLKCTHSDLMELKLGELND